MLENIRLAFQGIWSHMMRSFLTMLGYWGLGLFVRGKPRQNVLFVHDITRVRIVVLRGVNGCSGAPVRIRFLRYGEAAAQGREALFHQFKDGDGFRNQIHGKNAALPGFFHVPDQAVHGIKLVAFQQSHVQLFRPFRNCRQQIRHTHACSRSGNFRKANVQHAAEPKVDEVFQLHQGHQPFVLRFTEQGGKFIARFRLGVNAGDV